ncbi:hypothetical protein [Atopobium sp. BS2]|jgi:hypothetical protein|uniref:hypothetical protein n=1 Tax=Atopobium sp. BS2 TaxID=936550 RepID=UPI00068651A9|nr:hypothetical protein [Atopobium sp. BS2]
MDYHKAIESLTFVSNKDEILLNVFGIRKLHVPDTLDKYHGLGPNESFNKKKLETLDSSRVYMATVASLSLFDCRAYYRVDAIIERFGSEPASTK